MVRDGVLEDFALWRPGVPDGVGDLHRGRVLARAPGLGGAFVALADAEGFLPDTEGGSEASVGALIGVRVTRAAQGGKGPRLTARLGEEDAAPAGDGSVRLVRRGPSPLHELQARYPGAALVADPGAGGIPAQFDPSLEEQIAALDDAAVPLAGGGQMVIETTAALTAIDVDGGSASDDRRGKVIAHMAFNRAALPELARHIRLRNLSGAILIDFAGLSPRRRATLAPDLRIALASDPLGPRLLGFTQLGLAEIVRARIRPPLRELRAGAYAAGLAALRQVARCQPGRAVLRASPAIIAALQQDGVGLRELAERSGQTLILRADPALRGWRLEEQDV